MIRAIRSIRFGSVEVIVQDTQVVQIEIKKKARFDKDGAGNGNEDAGIASKQSTTLVGLNKRDES